MGEHKVGPTAVRVLLVTNMWPHGDDPSYGAFVQDQMESLRPLGVEYEVLFINGRASKWNYLRAVRELRRRLRASDFDLIHAHFGLSGCVARFQFRLPVVVTFHGDDVLGRFNGRGRVTPMGRLFQVSSFLLARTVTAVIVQSREMKAKLRLNQARVIPCGVDLELFCPADQSEARQALGLDPSRKFVLFPYDEAIPNKRFDLVKAAVERARESLPGLEILQVSKLPRSRLPLYLNAADVLVLASHSEGSPNTVKEAMAVNLPVITVDVGDAVDLIGDTPGCYIVPRETGAIAGRIIEACRARMRTQGRERMGRWSIENIAKQIVEVYASILR